MIELSQRERAVVELLQEGLPSGPEPYARMAAGAGTSEEDLLDTIRGLIDRGVVRRVGAVLNDRRLGYGANAMVVWRVGEDDLERAGAAAAEVAAVSHAFGRRSSPDWPYNLYVMVHARSAGELSEVLAELECVVGSGEYRALRTVRELSRKRPRYVGAPPLGHRPEAGSYGTAGSRLQQGD